MSHDFKIVVSIEARMGSSRYPNKMTTDIYGKSTLKHVIDRLKLSKLINNIVLATTLSKEDDVLCELAFKENIDFFRGSEKNVYERVSKAHQMMKSEVLVTVCGDCPLIDPFIIDYGITQFLKDNCNILTFKNNHFFPQGIEFNIFSSEVFHDPLSNIIDEAHKEHVGLFFFENFNLYKIAFIDDIFKKNYNKIRLQFDYKEDLDFLKKIYLLLIKNKGDLFNLHDIISIVESNPKILEINRNCIEKNVR